MVQATDTFLVTGFTNQQISADDILVTPTNASQGRLADLLLSAAMFGSLDLSSLPTSDPGGGRPWLNGGFLYVGP